MLTKIIPDTNWLVKNAYGNTDITETKKTNPDTSSKSKTGSKTSFSAEVTEIKNKTSDKKGLVKRTDYKTKIT